MADNYSEEELDELMSVDPSTLQSVDPGTTQTVVVNPSGPPGYMTDPYGLGEIVSVGNQPPPAAVPVVAQVAPPAAVPTTAPAVAPKQPVVVKQAPVKPSVEAAPNPGAPLGDAAYTTEAVGNLDKQADLVRQQGEIDQQAGEDLYFKQQQAADEKIQQAEDYKNYYKELLAKHNEDGERAKAAYNEFAAKAGSLKDPTQQYYSDHGGFGAQLASGVAAFASGLGAGLLGHAGNPFLDFLNNHINANFESHKQNIRDLYDKQVAAGKIADTNQNWAMFSAEAKLKAYELDSAHITNELQSIKDRAMGQQAKLTAQIGINGLEKQKLQLRNELAQKQAAALAKAKAEQRAAAAARAAEQKEARALVGKVYEQGLSSGMSSEEAALAAAKAGQTAGYDNLVLAPIMAGAGVAFDPKQDKFVIGEVRAPGKGGASNMSEGDKKMQSTIATNLPAIETMGTKGGLKRDKNGKWVPGGTGTNILPSSLSADNAEFDAAARSVSTGLALVAEAGGAPNETLIKSQTEAFNTKSQQKLAAELNRAEENLKKAQEGIDSRYNQTSKKPVQESKPADSETKVKKILFTKG